MLGIVTFWIWNVVCAVHNALHLFKLCMKPYTMDNKTSVHIQMFHFSEWPEAPCEPLNVWDSLLTAWGAWLFIIRCPASLGMQSKHMRAHTHTCRRMNNYDKRLPNRYLCNAETATIFTKWNQFSVLVPGSLLFLCYFFLQNVYNEIISNKAPSHTENRIKSRQLLMLFSI